MATNLVKWWKTRFINGYKQFTVLMPADSASESGRDTEELLSSVSAAHSPPPRASSPPAAAPPREPCCCNQTPAHATPRRELKFEEFECDVAVRGEEPAAEESAAAADKCRQCAPPRQEFSFTLYDLDGHGKITKDDIAGLVTTIYETLGATIQVPHSGSKTIRVRLTVAPESRTSSSGAQQQSSSCHKNEEAPSPKLSCNKESLYQNLSPSKLASNAEQLYSQLNFSPNKSKNNEVYYSTNSPNNSESVHYCANNRKSPMTVRVCNNESCKHQQSSRLLNNEENTRICDIEIPMSSPKPSVRFCNNETAPLINNMESPLTTKKLSAANDKIKERPPMALPKSCAPLSYSTPASPLRLSNSARVTVSSPRTSGRKLASHSASPARSRRRTAASSAANAAAATDTHGRERAYSGTLQRQELLHIIQANMEKNLLALQHNSTAHHRKRGDEAHAHHRHHGSASHKANLASARRLTKSNSTRAAPRKTVKTTVDPANNVISCSHYYLDLAGLESADLCPHCDKRGGKVHARSKSHDTTTHHLLKHKTRELDHARAMAQVVEWLQGAQLGGEAPAGTAPEEEEEDDEQEEEGAPRTHRHVHEHVHHHYHHYTDGALVV